MECEEVKKEAKENGETRDEVVCCGRPVQTSAKEGFGNPDKETGKRRPREAREEKSRSNRGSS
jgi:hypothetical protein